MEAIKKEALEMFLQEVDHDFPVPLSEKVDLKQYVEKVLQNADIVYKADGERLQGCVIGYCVNSYDDLVYIALVATGKDYRRRGIAAELVKEFIAMAKKYRKRAVHLYAALGANDAINVYKKIGFVDYVVENEPRPDAVHLIYYIEGNVI